MTFRSVLGHHSDHDRPRLRQLLGIALPASWRSKRTDPIEMELRRDLAREVASNIRARLLFHVQQPASSVSGGMLVASDEDRAA